MRKTDYDVIVVGGGPAGLAAAISAKKEGCDRVLIVDRDVEPGGILLQCVHNGFGLDTFKEDLPGPSYAQRYIDKARSCGVEFLLNTMVLEVHTDFTVVVTNDLSGVRYLTAKSIVFTMGCRERSRAQIRVPGSRPAGVYTAGTAQRWVNIDGIMPGKKFVILGSGDIGMIMARRLTLEGAKVDRVVEIMPYLSGLSRNLVQCLQDYDIPLFLRHTVSRILGKNRVEAVEISAVDEKMQPIEGTSEIVMCDTLLLSVGLIPENELTRRAGVKMDPRIGGAVVDDGYGVNIPGFFVAGNVVHVYDLVDYVSQAGEIAGRSAAQFAMKLSDGKAQAEKRIPVDAGEHVRYVVPQQIRPDSLSKTPITLQMRVTQPLERAVEVRVVAGETEVAKKRMAYARPGEMVSITLTEKMQDVIQQAERLTVHVG